MGLRKREDLDSAEGVDRGRIARRGAGSAVYTAVVFAVVVLLLSISMKLHTAWDLSLQSQNTLSPQTVEVLEALNEPVKITALFTTREPRRQAYWELLQLYARRSAQIEVEFIDPVARPGAVKGLGLNPQDDSTRRDGVTVVARGDRKTVFRGVEEEAITNAILDVGSTTKRVVGFLRGYGELDPTSRNDNGMARALESIQQEYYEAREVSLPGGIPPEITVLVIAAPRSPLPPEALATLTRWLEGGGRLLALLEPDADVGLNEVLGKWGLRATGRTIMEPNENEGGRPEFLKVVQFTRHAIVRGFGKNFPVAFPVAGDVVQFEPGDQTIFRDDLASSSRFSIAVEPDGTRVQGPFAVAAASWQRHPARGQETETRIVLVGDADFASNIYLPLRSNRNFFLNCLGWLSREQGLVSIRRQTLSGQTLDYDAKDTGKLAAAIFAAPILVILTGIVVVIRRRRM